MLVKSVLRSSRCSSAKGTILAYSGASGIAERGVADGDWSSRLGPDFGGFDRSC